MTMYNPTASTICSTCKHFEEVRAYGDDPEIFCKDRARTKHVLGICTCRESEHYSHAISHRHTICDVFQ